MTIQEERVLEGTWEEIALHAEELSGHRVRLTVLGDENGKPSQKEAPRPNEAALAALREIAKRQERRRETSAEDTDRLLREARAGGMYGYEPGNE